MAAQLRSATAERWGVSAPFGVATILLDRTLDCVANEPDFRLHG